MIRQQQLLMATEGIQLVFTDAAIDAIAATAAEVNRTLHNIGARRLHTVRPALAISEQWWVPPALSPTALLRACLGEPRPWEHLHDWPLRLADAPWAGPGAGC